ncbi:SpaA isopeptide-forming pilin-related protein [Lactococcus garvieae]|uniref:LPXTG-motif cell wall anchor domain-containing protein n=1 Tax=Lactococcus garvieae TaxID=1363 RepID=A0A1I4IT13_9LACT|nr:SpaA isopeptide-forming pilin-related protein [Lactococcus garvieae]SFL57488.1 LPXTG-motif cell wall anchor domain-containing protein [Lactococcus garvieae]
MEKHKHAIRRLAQALTKNTKVTHFSTRKVGKVWLTRSAVILALAGVTGIVATVNPSIISTVAHALTLPSGNTQIGSIGNAPVIQTSNNNFSTMQPLFDSLTGAIQPEYIVGDTQDGTGGKPIAWNSSTTYAGTAISNANSLISGANGLSYDTIHYGMGISDGFQDGDKFNYLKQGQAIAIHNVGTAYNVKTGKNIPVGMKVTINDATYYDSTTSSSPRNVFGDGFRLLVGARNNGGTITLGYMVSMDGIPNSGSGQGSEGGGSGGSGGDAIGAASGIPESVRGVITIVDESNGNPLSSSTLMAMKVSDIDAGQSAQLSNGALGYIVSKPTNLELRNNILTAKGNDTVVGDNANLNANSYIALYNGASTALNFVDTNGNQGQGSIVQAVFGNLGSTSPHQSLGYIEIDKTTIQYGKDLPNNLYDFQDISFDVLDSTGKKVDTLKLDSSGKSVKSKGLPPGKYTLHETSGKWSSTGQTVLPDFTVEVKAGDTTTAKPKNTAVTGEISIKKSGVESGDAMWNENYTLEGTTFKLTSKTDGKTYTAVIGKESNGEWKTTVKDLPLGTYTIEETKASPGFTNTFEKKEVTLSYKDQHTEIVFGETKGTNQEVKGENTLKKSDNETGTDQNGKGVLKTAKYAYFHDDDSTGSSPHKKGDPVKWSEKPAPKLLAGEVVHSAIIGGNPVSYGDNVVIDVDDESLTAALGNLAAGKYYSVEVDAGEGYVTDPTKHYFEIKKQDDKTQNIVTPESSSKEQLIKAKITLDKMVTLPDSQGGSGYNGIEFTAEPMEGTVADPVKFVTGVNPNTGDDGYASQELAYGDWKVSETKGVEGYEDVKPVYIHMETDTEKDILTISASYYEDFSKPFSKRSFSLKDSSTSSNPNGEGTVGEVTPEVPTISLSTIHFNDNPTLEKVPSIDIEKANDKIPEPGEGNFKDKDNNGDENDRDTPDTALVVEPDKSTKITSRFTNNGTEALSHLTVSDKTIEGKIDVKAFTWTFKGQKLSTNKEGEFITADGKLLVLQPDEFVTGEAELPPLTDGQLHGDELTVGGIGVESGKEVGDSDKWYGKPKEEAPSIDIEKADTKMPESGEGNHKDKPNNAGENDHDTEDTGKELEENKATEILMKGKNNGTEPLSHIKVVDKTIAGQVDVKNIKWTYKGKPLKVNKDGELTTEDGKLLILNPGETIEGRGTLEGLAAGDVHGDNVSIEGEGTRSGKKVGDDDNWYGKVSPKTPEQPKNNTFNISLPKTGMKAQTILTAIAAVIVVIVAGLGTFFYRKNKMK